MVRSETKIPPGPALPEAHVTVQDGKDCLYNLGPVRKSKVTLGVIKGKVLTCA